MKIAFVVHDYHRAGGHSRYVAELATRFAKEHEVHVFANRIERDGTASIRFHTVPAWRANALTTVLTFALPASLQIGRGFDIVHSQGFCAFRGNVFTGHICNRARYLALAQLHEGRLLFVSSTPAGAYQRMAEEAGLAGRTLFLGATNQIEKVYAAVDALLLPTSYDAFGMVVSEAMACGLPVVVSREAGAAELVQHRVNGLLLDDVTNVTELAGHMESLLR